MPAGLRAAISLLFLIGFYVLGLLQLALALWLCFEIVEHAHGAVAGKGVLLVLAGVGAVLGGLWKALRNPKGKPEGMPTTPQNSPELWYEVSRLAAEAGTRMPDEIRLIPDVNAAVSEDSKLLGLVAGRRYMYIGVPLLTTMTVDQLRAVLAHELGHYSGSHTRLGGIAYRGRRAVDHTLARLGSANPFGWVFKGYAWVYRKFDTAGAHRQEFEADQAAVRVAGADAAVGMLRDLEIIDKAWNFYFGRYIEAGWDIGYAPDDFFGGFAHLYAARADEINEMRAEAESPAKPAERVHKVKMGEGWDTHPPTSARIAAIRALPPVPRQADGRSAMILLPRIAEAGMALQREVFAIGHRTVLPWPQFTAATMVIRQQRRADEIMRAIGRRAGRPVSGLADVLDIGVATKDELDVLIAYAAVRSGVAFWKHSWSGPAELVDAQGNEVDYEAIAESPGTARARLAELGIRPDGVALVEQRASGAGAEIIAGIPNVKVDGAEHDLIVLDKGFVLPPAPKRTDEGESRIGGYARMDPAALTAQYRFLPFEEVTAVNVIKDIPIRFALTLHGGSTVTIEERWSSSNIGNSRDVVHSVLKRIATTVRS